MNGKLTANPSLHQGMIPFIYRNIIPTLQVSYYMVKIYNYCCPVNNYSARTPIIMISPCLRYYRSYSHGASLVEIKNP